MILDKNGAMYHSISMKTTTKAMTIRLSEEQAEALEALASVDRQPISEVIRAAVAGHIDARKKDPDFQSSLKDRLSRTKRLLGTK